MASQACNSGRLERLALITLEHVWLVAVEGDSHHSLHAIGVTAYGSHNLMFPILSMAEHGIKR